MKTVLCTNPNATSPINGIEFLPVDGGLMSGPLDDAQASQFDGTGKYFQVLDVESKPEEPPTQEGDLEKDKKPKSPETPPKK